MDFLLVFLAMVPGTYSLSPESEFTGLVGGSVSVPCHYDVKYRDHVKYWCRAWTWTSCTVLGRTDEPQDDEGKILISDDRTRGVFTVTLRRLEKKDEGWYWCAIQKSGFDVKFELHLHVVDGTSSLSLQRNITGWVGDSISVLCHYDLKYRHHVKYWCTGRLWSNCTVLKRTDGSMNDEDKILINDDKTQGVFTVTVRRLEKKDAGQYWCGLEKKGYIKIDKHFQIHLDVVDAPATPQTTMPSTFSTRSNQHTSQETTTIIQYSSSLQTSSRPDSSKGNGSTRLLLMVLYWILPALLVPVLFCTWKIIRTKVGKNKKQEDDKDCNSSKESEECVTYITVSFHKKVPTYTEGKEPGDPEENTIYSTLALNN
ncbi:polymeric immunoglobulin receptor-like isoform X1 [Acipenser ruthenus]|uniref:polymeric immunoglobulin receptor-like isoform X1 n=1 Tax=Acipenser ruthenus TaxID=7906 RepID=UPI0027416FBC|nr:polymeric immunoglobulin receptor-like isoform X1 [Acipenser ruthenus]